MTWPGIFLNEQHITTTLHPHKSFYDPCHWDINTGTDESTDELPINKFDETTVYPIKCKVSDFYIQWITQFPFRKYKYISGHFPALSHDRFLSKSEKGWFVLAQLFTNSNMLPILFRQKCFGNVALQLRLTFRKKKSRENYNN